MNQKICRKVSLRALNCLVFLPSIRGLMNNYLPVRQFWFMNYSYDPLLRVNCQVITFRVQSCLCVCRKSELDKCNVSKRSIISTHLSSISNTVSFYGLVSSFCYSVMKIILSYFISTNKWKIPKYKTDAKYCCSKVQPSVSSKSL